MHAKMPSSHMKTNTKRRKRHDLNTKLTAVQALEAGKDVIGIATSLGIATTQLYRWRDQMLRKGLISQDQVVTQTKFTRGGVNAWAEYVGLKWICPGCHAENSTKLESRYAPARCAKCRCGFWIEELLGTQRYYAMSRLFPKKKDTQMKQQNKEVLTMAKH